MVPTADGQGGRAARRIAGVGLAVLGGVPWLAVAFVLVFTVPRFAEIFAKFEGQVPAVTQAVLAAGKFVSNYWYLCAMMWLALVGGLAGLCLIVPGRWPAAVAVGWAGVSVVGAAAIMAVTVMALFLPLVRLTEDLGAP
jgi:hypothetical protein